jgi:hypothetical protein
MAVMMAVMVVTIMMPVVTTIVIMMAVVPVVMVPLVRVPSMVAPVIAIVGESRGAREHRKKQGGGDNTFHASLLEPFNSTHLRTYYRKRQLT